MVSPFPQYVELPRPPRVWTVFAALGAVLAVVLVGGLMIVMAHVQAEPGLSAQARAEKLQETAEALLSSPIGLFEVAGLNQAAFYGAAIVPALFSKVPFVERLRIGPSTARFADLFFVVLGFVGLSIGGSAVVDLLGVHPSGGAMEHLERGIVKAAESPAVLGLLGALVGIVGPIGEELFFRGYMQTRLTRRWGRVAGILITAAIFGAMHMDLLQGSFAFLFGLFLGWTAERYAGIRPGMLAHAVNNSLFTVFAFVPAGDDQRSLSVAMAAGGLLAFGVSVFFLARRRAA